jgi:hypothetical protein
MVYISVPRNRLSPRFIYQFDHINVGVDSALVSCPATSGRKELLASVGLRQRMQANFKAVVELKAAHIKVST